MIAARAEDTTDIENSDSDDDANEKTPTPPSSTNPSSERGSSPDKQLPGPGGENTAVHPDDGEKHAPDPVEPPLRPARHSIDQIVAQLDPHAPQLEPDVPNAMSAEVANGNGAHKVGISIEDPGSSDSGSDDKPIVAATTTATPPKPTAAPTMQYKGKVPGCEACAKGFARADLMSGHYMSEHQDDLDDLDQILNADPANEEVEARSKAPTPVAPAAAPAVAPAKPTEWGKLASSIYELEGRAPSPAVVAGGRGGRGGRGRGRGRGRGGRGGRGAAIVLATRVAPEGSDMAPPPASTPPPASEVAPEVAPEAAPEAAPDAANASAPAPPPAPTPPPAPSPPPAPVVTEPLPGYTVMLMPKSKAKKRACCFCGDLFKPNGMKKHIHSCSAVPAAFRPEMIPPLYFMVRTDTLNKGGAQEGGAKPAVAAKKKPVPPPPEEDKDSSTGHEGDDSEDAETANKGDKGPTPNSKRSAPRVSTPGEIDDDDVRRSKRPHRRSEDVEALIQAETHHPRSTEKTAKVAAAAATTGGGGGGSNTPGVHVRLANNGGFKCGECGMTRDGERGLKQHVTKVHGKATNWVIEDEALAKSPAAVGGRGGRGGGRGRGRGRGAGRGRGRGRGGRGGRGGRHARASAVDVAAGEVETESDGPSDIDAEEEDDAVFEMRAAATGSRGTRGRSDKDATAVSSGDDDSDDDEGQQTGKRPTPGGVARFAAGVGANDEDGDGDSEANFKQAVRAAGDRKRGSVADATGGRDSKRAKMEYHEACPVCDKVFKGPQGMPSHYKIHVKSDDADERRRGQELLNEFNAISSVRKAEAKTVKQGKTPTSARAPGSGGRKPSARSIEVPRFDEEPIELGPQAKSCSTCQARFTNRDALIKHMWESHRLRAVPAPAESEPRVNGVDGMDGAAARAVAAAAAVAMVPHGGFGGLSTMPSPATGLISAGAGMSLGDHAGDDVLSNIYEQLAVQKEEIRALNARINAMSAASNLAAPPFVDDSTIVPEIKRVQVRGAKPGYSPIVTFGRMVWLTGIVALNTDNQFVEAQTKQALEHMTVLLNKAGTNPEHLLRVNVYLSDIRTADHMYRAWNSYFDSLGLQEEQRPVRITHQATLKDAGFRVEVHAEAVLPAVPKLKA